MVDLDVQCGYFGFVYIDVWCIVQLFSVDILFVQCVDDCLFDLVDVVMYIDVQLLQLQQWVYYQLFGIVIGYLVVVVYMQYWDIVGGQYVFVFVGLVQGEYWVVFDYLEFVGCVVGMGIGEMLYCMLDWCVGLVVEVVYLCWLCCLGVWGRCGGVGVYSVYFIFG